MVKMTEKQLMMMFLHGEGDILYRYHSKGKWTGWRSFFNTVVREQRQGGGVVWPWEYAGNPYIDRVEWKRGNPIVHKMTEEQQYRLCSWGTWL